MKEQEGGLTKEDEEEGFKGAVAAALLAMVRSSSP
jgi:hypothetical protein